MNTLLKAVFGHYKPQTTLLVTLKKNPFFLIPGNCRRPFSCDFEQIVTTPDYLKSLPAVSVLINCTSSPIFRVISDCFFATQSTEHGQLLKVVSRSDKWLNPCTKAFLLRV